MKRKMLFVIFVLAGVLVLSAVLVIPHHTSAQYIPSVTLTFPASQQVEVYPGANGTAVFSGKLTISCNYATSTVISVKSQSAGTEGWTVAISPCGVSCEPGTNIETNVTVTVWVPPETNQTSGNIELLAETKTTTPGVATSNEGGATIQVQVKPYYMLSVGCAVPYKESVSGSNVTFCLEVKNLGNAMINDVRFGIQNSDELSGWTVIIFPAGTMLLHAHEAKIINISVAPPQNISQLIGTAHKIIVEVISLSCNVSDNCSLYIRILDITSPVISNALATPSLQVQGKYVNITCTVTDNVAVNLVRVNVTGPEGFALVNLSMIRITGTDNYYYNSTYSISGEYYYYIWARDASNNQNISTVYTFEISIPTQPPTAEQKGFIPGFETFLLLIVLTGCAGIGIRRRKKASPPEKPASK